MPNRRPAVAAVVARVLAAFAALPGIAIAQLESSPIVFRSGDWAVHRTQDSMTDANICTAIYRNNAAIQLASHSLTIAIANGLKDVTLRFDNENARQLRLPKRSERAVSAVAIEGEDFTYLLRSNRLRYRVLTLDDGLVEGDIDLTGASDALKNIQSGCVGDPLTDR
jgi:invasion protein IalB